MRINIPVGGLVDLMDQREDILDRAIKETLPDSPEPASPIAGPSGTSQASGTARTSGRSTSRSRKKASPKKGPQPQQKETVPSRGGRRRPTSLAVNTANGRTPVTIPNLMDVPVEPGLLERRRGGYHTGPSWFSARGRIVPGQIQAQGRHLNLPPLLPRPTTSTPLLRGLLTNNTIVQSPVTPPTPMGQINGDLFRAPVVLPPRTPPAQVNGHVFRTPEVPRTRGVDIYSLPPPVPTIRTTVPGWVPTPVLAMSTMTWPGLGVRDQAVVTQEMNVAHSPGAASGLEMFQRPARLAYIWNPSGGPCNHLSGLFYASHILDNVVITCPHSMLAPVEINLNELTTVEDFNAGYEYILFILNSLYSYFLHNLCSQNQYLRTLSRIDTFSNLPQFRAASIKFKDEFNGWTPTAIVRRDITREGLQRQFALSGIYMKYTLRPSQFAGKEVRFTKCQRCNNDNQD